MAINWNFRSLSAFIVLFFVAQLLGVVKAEIESAHRTATAIRIEGTPPKLDGILNDDIWKTAPLHEGFRQRDPDEANPHLNALPSKSPTMTRQFILASYAMIATQIKSFLG